MFRKCSFVDNTSDWLKVLNILSLQSIRKFNRAEKTNILMTDDEESNLIKSFFVNENSSTLTERKWDAPVFE